MHPSSLKTIYYSFFKFYLIYAWGQNENYLKKLSPFQNKPITIIKSTQQGLSSEWTIECKWNSKN